MKIEDVRPADCFARAQRLLAEVALVREEMGRSEDTRALPEAAEANPRDCYFEALATWHKADRLASEVGAHSSRVSHPAPVLRDLKPGHVLQVIDAVLGQLDGVRATLQISERVQEAAPDTARQPRDVLVTLVRINRELSRTIERPFTPADVYGRVALASTYATRLGASVELAPFERRRKPHHCYERLLACHAAVAGLITKKGETALAVRGTPTDVLPGDVYDLASLVLGEVAFLHSLTPNAGPVHAFEPAPSGHRLPAHVDQLARTLETQLARLA